MRAARGPTEAGDPVEMPADLADPSGGPMREWPPGTARGSWREAMGGGTER